MKGPDEPLIYSLENEQVSAPVVISCDHASNRIPKAFQQLGLADEHLQQHIAYDIGALQVANALAKFFNFPLISSNYSRLLVDLNRHPHDPSAIPEVSDEIVIPGNSGLTEEQRQNRLSDYFYPYHNRHSELVDNASDDYKNPFVLAIHSFTPEMQSIARPWHYGVLWGHSQNLSSKFVKRLQQLPGRFIGENQPYHALEPRGYSQDVHGADRDVDVILLEIRQDLIHTPAGQESIAEELCQAIEPLIDFSRTV